MMSSSVSSSLSSGRLIPTITDTLSAVFWIGMLVSSTFSAVIECIPVLVSSNFRIYFPFTGLNVISPIYLDFKTNSNVIGSPFRSGICRVPFNPPVDIESSSRLPPYFVFNSNIL